MNVMKEKIKIIGFDADDTLWVNEPFYRETEKKFSDLLKEYLPEEAIMQRLFRTEMQNLELYGYGAKGFMLSLIETGIKISDNSLPNDKILQIIQLGKDLINNPLEVLDGVHEVLEKLSKKYKLIIATKGDLLDQERKLEKSKLAKYFHHIEIMSDKKAENYQKLIAHLDISSEEFVMVGNSMKSDVLPVLELGSCSIHVPFHTTWVHEEVNGSKIESDNFYEVKSISDILAFFE